MRINSQNLPALQYQFELDGGRSNQLFLLVNNTATDMELSEISFKTNADIHSPWQALSAQWPKSTRIQQGDFYIYNLILDSPIILKSGKNKMLEYGVDKALGPLAIDMPPREITVKLQSSDTQKLSSVDSNNPISNPLPNIEFNKYYADWGQYEYKKTMSNADFSQYNNLSYAFIAFDENGNVKSYDSWADSQDLVTLAIKKQKYPYLKTTLSFGGWTNGGVRMNGVFSRMAADPAERKKFVENAVRAVMIADANGIDIDWEFVASMDADNFVSLLQELRAALVKANIPDARLTIAAPAGIENIQAINREQWAAISAVVDRISLMTYDYFGAFSDKADFNSADALSPNSPHAQSGGASSYYSVEKTIGVYDALGVPRKKLSMGIPNYARGMIVETVGKYAGLYQKIVEVPKGDHGEDGLYSWETIQKFFNKQPSALDNLGVTAWHYYDSSHSLCSDAKMCLLSGDLPDGRCVVINFLDPASAKWHAQKALRLGLGGAMMWANYEDSDTDSISEAVFQGLSASLPGEPSAPSLDLLVAPPSYFDVIQPPSYHDVARSLPPPPNYFDVINNTPPSAVYRDFQLHKERTALNSMTLIEKLFCAHLSNLSEKWGQASAEKCQIMLDLFGKRNNVKKMQKCLEDNRKNLSEHRNIIKYGITKIVGENLSVKMFGKPKSLFLAERLLEEAEAGQAWNRQSN